MLGIVDGLNSFFMDGEGARTWSGPGPEPAHAHAHAHSHSHTDHMDSGVVNGPGAPSASTSTNTSTGASNSTSTGARTSTNTSTGTSPPRAQPVSALNPSAKGKQFLRSFGMLGVHSLGALKHRIARFAMGL
jgi:hypothetical protein